MKSIQHNATMKASFTKTFLIIVAIPLLLLIFAFGIDYLSHTNQYPLFYCTLTTLGIHWTIACISIYLKTEKFFDITGTVAVLSMIYVAISHTYNLSSRAIILASLCCIWTIRLGIFLLYRVHKRKKDRRFDQIKESKSDFLITWELSAAWTLITISCALCAMTSAKEATIKSIDYILIFGWLAAFTTEVCADYQKNKFKDKKTKNQFIQTGLWKYCRHPNYFGEITMWIFIAGLALPSLHSAAYVTLASPLFVYWLLTKVSGINILEAQNEKQYGHLAEYQKYKAQTPKLLPFKKILNLKK